MCNNKKIKDSASFAISPQIIDVLPAAFFRIQNTENTRLLPMNRDTAWQAKG